VYPQKNKESRSFPCQNRHVDKNQKNYIKIQTPTSLSRSFNKKRKGPVSTSTRQSTSYVTVKGIESETSYQEPDWPVFTMKELMDNAYDFLNDYYSNESKEARKIAVRVKVDSSSSNILRMAVRNSNVNNIPVFENLEQVFDYDRWYSSKRNQHRMTCGSLGDFLKRVLGMGYASWTSNDNLEDSFIDKQWKEPVILRFNKQECKAFIIVDRDNHTISSDVKEPTKFDAPDFTEVEIALPLPGHYWNEEEQHQHEVLLLDRLEKYYKIYKLAKSRTDFSFCKKDELVVKGGGKEEYEKGKQQKEEDD
jgi:hypothetical protein